MSTIGSFGAAGGTGWAAGVHPAPFDFHHLRIDDVALSSNGASGTLRVAGATIVVHGRDDVDDPSKGMIQLYPEDPAHATRFLDPAECRDLAAALERAAAASGAKDLARMRDIVAEIASPPSMRGGIAAAIRAELESRAGGRGGVAGEVRDIARAAGAMVRGEPLEPRRQGPIGGAIEAILRSRPVREAYGFTQGRAVAGEIRRAASSGNPGGTARAASELVHDLRRNWENPLRRELVNVAIEKLADDGALGEVVALLRRTGTGAGIEKTLSDYLAAHGTEAARRAWQDATRP